MPAPSRSEVKLQDLLTDAAVYPHEPEDLKIEQTHISVVAVVPPWVYKFKKPVDLGFVDFSSLEKRLHYCHEEVRLNKRLCPEIYDGVVPLVRKQEGVRVDPWNETGEVVDYAVKMRYVDTNQTLEARLKSKEATTVHIDRIARCLCAFYRETTATPEAAEAGWPEQIRMNIDENFEQTEAHVGSVFSRPAYDALWYYFDRTLDQRSSLFHKRRANGRVIEGHGDLRLDHAHLTEERVCILDCIEFNDRFRQLDVANDVAFLAMDLDVAGHSSLAQRFVDQVAEGLNDPDLRTLQPFYKAYRAHVRAKVEAIRAADEAVQEEDRQESYQLARMHARWALRYAVSGGAPLVVVVMGRPATGKSTHATWLAESLGWTHIASDRVRKRIAGVSLDERAEKATRDVLYTDEMSRKTYESLREQAVERGRQKKGTVLDATYSSVQRRNRLRSALQASELPYVFVELTAPDDVLRERLKARSDESPTASDARLEDFDTLRERYEAPNALEDARQVRIDATQPPSDTRRTLLKTLIRLSGTL